MEPKQRGLSNMSQFMIVVGDGSAIHEDLEIGTARPEDQNKELIRKAAPIRSACFYFTSCRHGRSPRF
jgi:hypothetical protein